MNKFFLILLISLTVHSCKTPVPAAEDIVPPVYVTVAGHIEDVPVYASPDGYGEYRKRLLVFAEEFSDNGMAFNLQIDYEFLIGTIRHETDSMRAETAGLNIIEYLTLFIQK